MGILHVRDHGLVVLTPLVCDDAEQACVGNGDALEVAVFTWSCVRFFLIGDLGDVCRLTENQYSFLQ